MTLPDWREEPVARQDRQGFDCGDVALNGFLRAHARKNHERGASKTFLAVSRTDSRTVLGFYTLSPASAEFERVPARFTKGLGRYEVGGFTLARLAIDKSVRGCGLGGSLLLAAARRCIRAAHEVGGTLMFIDAKTEAVAAWYRKYGALSLDDRPLTLFLPLASFEEGLRQAGR